MRRRVRHGCRSETAQELLRGPAHSNSGLGIGLYQVARQAEASGFTLALADNVDGTVSFVLSGEPGAAAAPHGSSAA